MKLHGICLVKNEADIIEYTLTEAARWCDNIYVFDNGSADETWDVVKRLAATVGNIVPFKQDGRPFDNNLRAEVYNHYKSRAVDGDWWCRLDGDEVYADDPRLFLARVPRAYHVVWAVHLQFYLTPSDVDQLSSAQEKPSAVDASSLPRSYAANASETRFFRHRQRLEWAQGAWPRHLGLVFPERIRVKHFQYRSPAQIQLRLDTRHRAIQQGTPDFPHIDVTAWREALRSEGLSLDEGDGRYEIDESRLPSFLESPGQRILKRLLHGTGIWP